MFRWVTSRHTRDIITLGAIIIIILVVFGWLEKDSEPFKSNPSALGAVVTVAVGMIAWLHRTANQRLVVVDAIASNIFSILRISTSLFVVQNLIPRYRHNIVSTDTIQMI